MRTSNVECQFFQWDLPWRPVVTWRKASTLIFVPRLECTQAILREIESAAPIARDENRRCGNIGLGRDSSNSDTMNLERGGSRCEPMGQWCRCRSKRYGLQTPRALPRRCLNLNHQTRMSGNRLSSHAPTCFPDYRRRVDRAHAGPSDTGFHPTMFAPRTKRDATCQPGGVRNLNSHWQTIFQERRSAGRNLAYAPMRRNSKVVSGLMTSPFISRSG